MAKDRLEPNIFDDILSKAKEEAITKGTWNQGSQGGPEDPGPPNETKFSKTAHKMVLECAAYDPAAFKTLGIRNLYELAWIKAEKKRGIKPRFVGFLKELAKELGRSRKQTERDFHHLENFGWVIRYNTGRPERINPLNGIPYPKAYTIFTMPWNVKDRIRQLITARIEAQKKASGSPAPKMS